MPNAGHLECTASSSKTAGEVREHLTHTTAIERNKEWYKESHSAASLTLAFETGRSISQVLGWMGQEIVRVQLARA